VNAGPLLQQKNPEHVLKLKTYNPSITDSEGPRRRIEGGEWEPIKILLENMAYTQNLSRNPSLQARPRLSSYRLAIGPRNRARNHT
jgi:hypothetical protein